MVRSRTALRVVVWLGLVGGMAGVLWADARSDLDSAKRDYESLKSRTDELKDKMDRYLEQSRKLRSMDKEQLDSLVDKLCRLDIEPDDPEVESIVRDLTDRVVDNVRRTYDDASRAGSDMVGLVERHLDSVKTLRNRAKDLRSQDAIKDGASRLTDDAEKLVEVVDRLMEKLQSDFKTLDRVKNGVMSGANNPVIRAKMEYGKEKHRSLQSSRSCDEREVVLSSGRPDCIKFESDDGKIIEFKPDTYSIGDAETQARKYLDDVRRKFKDDDRAKKCKRDADGYPIFRPVGETYTTCKS